MEQMIRNRRWYSLILSLTLCLVLFNFSFMGLLIAEEVNSTSCPTPCFVHAKIVKRGSPIYPSKESSASNSGLVDLNLMVNKDGRVFEPIVLKSSKESFERAALYAVRNYQYSPALLDGAPVVSSAKVQIIFVMEDSVDGTSSSFAR